MVLAKKRSALLLTSVCDLHPTSPELAFCRFLLNYGLSPLVLCPEEGSLSRGLSAKGFEVKVLRHIQRWRSLKGRILAPWLTAGICRFVRQHEVLLVHSARMSTTPLALKAARRLEVPCISHLHGDTREGEKFRRYLVHQADAVIGVSQAALSRYAAPAGQEVAVVYNGLDIEEFRAHAARFDARSHLGLKEGMIVGMSGAYHLKGLDSFVDAAQGIRRRFPETNFVVMGEFRSRDFQQEISRRIAETGMTEAFFFAGFQENIAPFMAACDLWAVPSRLDAAPMVAIEAMALGKPVVGSRVGGIPELVEDGVTGIIVPPEDPGALAEAVCELLANPDLRNSFGEAGRRRVADRFSFDHFRGRMAEIYEHLISGSKP